MKRKLLAKSLVTAIAFSLISASGAVAQGQSHGRQPADKAEKVKVITDAIGIDSETVSTRRQAGQSLATIAGAKVDSLMAALLAFDSKKIDSAVASGKITAAQATELKANLITRVTEVANRVGKKIKAEKAQQGSGN